jgi:hypothetical protein
VCVYEADTYTHTEGERDKRGKEIEIENAIKKDI